MKPYGLPRNLNVQWPDVADVHTYARKSSVGCFMLPCRKHRGLIANKAAKQRTRRRFKRSARREGHVDIVAQREE